VSPLHYGAHQAFQGGLYGTRDRRPLWRGSLCRKNVASQGYDVAMLSRLCMDDDTTVHGCGVFFEAVPAVGQVDVVSIWTDENNCLRINVNRKKKCFTPIPLLPFSLDLTNQRQIFHERRSLIVKMAQLGECPCASWERSPGKVGPVVRTT